MGPCVLSTDGVAYPPSFPLRGGFNGTVRSQHGWQSGSGHRVIAGLASMGPCVLSTDGRPLFRWARAGIKLQWDRAFSARMAGERLYGNRHRSQASMGPCVLSTEGAEGRRGGAERHGASMGPCVLSTDGP